MTERDLITNGPVGTVYFDDTTNEWHVRATWTDESREDMFRGAKQAGAADATHGAALG